MVSYRCYTLRVIKGGIAVKSTRLNITIDNQTNERLELSAKELGVSKAAMIRIMINQYYREEEALQAVSKMEELIQVISTNKNAAK